MAMHKPRRELLAIWRFYLILAALIPAFVISLIFSFPGGWWLLATGIWFALFVGLFAVYLPLLFQSRAYAVEKERIVSYGGVVYRYCHSLPLASIQYITLLASPLARLFRICSLVVVAPGGRMILDGLTRSDGEHLLEILTDAAIANPTDL
jgi:membrane protein YdbS with pleckstrin-like domain